MHIFQYCLPIVIRGLPRKAVKNHERLANDEGTT